MTITIIVLVSISIGFLGGAALASLRKPPEMPTIQPPTPTLTFIPQPTRQQRRVMRARRAELRKSITHWN